MTDNRTKKVFKMSTNKIMVIGSYLVALVMDSERIPLKGETLMATNFRTTHGGKGSNQAVQAARLGARVNFAGRIGNDPFGKSFLELLNAENIDAECVFISDDLPTGAGFIISAADGQNLITIDIAATRQFSKHDIDLSLKTVSKDDIVLAQLEIPTGIALYALSQAKKKGAVTILNPAPAHNFSGQDLEYIDILTPNETEARICIGMAPNENIPDQVVARQLMETGCKHVIITLGERGSLWFHNGVAHAIPPFAVDRVVDSTGAGDAFNAALAVAMAEGKEMPEAIYFANAAGALSVTKSDTIPSYHSRNEVNTFIENALVKNNGLFVTYPM
jgi:ribokinase